MAERSVCQAGAMGRRSFLAVASETALLALLAAVTPPVPVEAVQIAPEDPRFKTGRVTVPNYAGGLQCYSARPASESGALGSVLVMHDILGLTPHYEDVARRFAIEGFHANGKVAAVGFGLGGSALGRAVMRLPEISAAVLLYGRVPPADHVIEIKTPLLLIYAGEDPVVNSDVPGFLDALGAAGQHPDVETYSGACLGFDDDTQGARYSPEAAALAWKRIVTFIRPLIG